MYMNEETARHIIKKSPAGSKPVKSGCEEGPLIKRPTSGLLKLDQINLLVKIDALGSISKATRAVGMSCITAWGMIMAINSHAGKPLVRRLNVGGGNGVTRLTDEGKRVVALSILLRLID